MGATPEAFWIVFYWLSCCTAFGLGYALKDWLDGRSNDDDDDDDDGDDAGYPHERFAV